MPKNINELLNLLLLYYHKNKNGIKHYGILLAVLSADKTIIKSIGEDTGNFAVNCFCPLLLIENNLVITYNLENYNNIEITFTNYFIVGGHNYGKKEGKLILRNHPMLKPRYLM